MIIFGKDKMLDESNAKEFSCLFETSGHFPILERGVGGTGGVCHPLSLCNEPPRNHVTKTPLLGCFRFTWLRGQDLHPREGGSGISEIERAK